MILLALLVIFIVVPIAELYVIIKVGEAIGVFPTIVLLLADSIAGSILMRSQGRAAWRRFTEALSSGRVPAREVIDGALVILGGAFLITPGFLSDIIGALLLIPPTRALFRSLLMRRFARRLIVRVARPAGRRAAADGRSDDVDGTAVEIDEPRLPR